MEWLRKYLIDAIAVALLLALLVAAVVPWAVPEPVVRKDRTPPVGQAASAQSPVAARSADPAAIAVVFGYRAPPPITSRESPGPRRETASWISFIGYVLDEKGEKKYFFKDTRGNQVLTLTLGKDNGKGWKLVSVGEKSYILENKGTAYTVPK
jgi:hypothetical protein